MDLTSSQMHEKRPKLSKMMNTMQKEKTKYLSCMREFSLMLE